jgi:hypothetical protein
LAGYDPHCPFCPYLHPVALFVVISLARDESWSGEDRIEEIDIGGVIEAMGPAQFAKGRVLAWPRGK